MTTNDDESQRAPKSPESEPFHPSIEQIEELLWRDTTDDVCVYAILDGDWVPGLYGRLVNAQGLSWVHMFQGRSSLANVQNAPFVVALKRGHAFNRWLIGKGWGQGWGIYFTASTSEALSRYGKSTIRDPHFLPSTQEQIQLGKLTEGQDDPLWLMRHHFRHFSDVEFEDDGRIVDFRYYDPATLRVYLPTCNPQELFRFFGPVKMFFAEGFSELESLNRSQNIYLFAAPMDEDGKRYFWGRRFDMQTGNTQELQLHPAAEKPAEREGELLTMIRTAQCEAFREEQFRIHAENIALDIIALAKGRLPLSPNQIRADVYEAHGAALQAGLLSRTDVTNYVLCWLRDRDAFAARMSTITDDDISSKLNAWANNGFVE